MAKILDSALVIPCALCTRFFSLDHVASGAYLPEALMCFDCVEGLPSQVACMGKRFDTACSECERCPDRQICESWEDVMELKVTKEAREQALELLIEDRKTRLKKAPKFSKLKHAQPFKPSLVGTFFAMAQQEGGMEIEEIKRLCQDAGVDWSQCIRKIYQCAVPGWEWKFKRTDTHLHVYDVQSFV